MIGEGSYSEVYQARILNPRLAVNYDEVAVKVPIDWGDESISKEMRLLTEMQKVSPHAPFNFLLGSFAIKVYKDPDDLKLCPVYPLSAISLSKFMKDFPDGVSFDCCRAALKTLVVSMEALRGFEEGVVHLDIKLANIVIGDLGDPWHTLRLIDFGTFEPYGEEADFCATTLFVRSPERLACCMEQECLPPAGPWDDIWAVGCVVATLFLGDRLFKGESVLEMLASISKIYGRIERSPGEGLLLQSLWDYWEVLSDPARKAEISEKQESLFECFNEGEPEDCEEEVDCFVREICTGVPERISTEKSSVRERLRGVFNEKGGFIKDKHSLGLFLELLSSVFTHSSNRITLENLSTYSFLDPYVPELPTDPMELVDGFFV